MKTLEKKSNGSRLLRYSPSRVLSPLDRFFRNDLLDFWDGGQETIPSVNITEEKNNYRVELAAPGLKKDDFNINVEGNLVTISCDTENEIRETKEGGFTRREYDYSYFTRSFTLPDAADTGNVHAKYNDGILSLDIPKKAEALKTQAHKIKVE